MNVLSSATMHAAPKLVGLIVGTAVVVFAWLGPVAHNWAPSATAEATVPDPSSFRDQLHTAKVSYGAMQSTEWTGNRWISDLRPWHWVGRYHGKASEDGIPVWKPCIWAHPAKGKSLTITFPRVPLQDELAGHVAMLDTPHDGKAATFTVRVDGRAARRIRLGPSRGGWREWRADTAGKQGQKADVVFEITSRHPNWRHVCFTAFIGPGTP